MHVTIPARWVAGGFRTSVCARHGVPAELTVATRLESAPAPWTWALVPLGGIVFLLVRAVTRRELPAPRWAFCGRCQSRRLRRLAAGWALVAAAVLGLVFAIATSAPDSANPDLGFVQFLVLLAVGVAGWLVLLTSRWPVIARARVRRDDGDVEVRRPAAAFANEVEAALNAAHPSALVRP
jgi:hypothetical protein